MKRSVSLLWRIFLLGLAAVIIVLLLANFGVFGKMPSLQELENPEADLASEIISSDGVLMGKYYSENRSEVRFDEIYQMFFMLLQQQKMNVFLITQVSMRKHLDEQYFP